ncbi:MAG TPA: XRE family transcriptional regulator [Acidobacteriaceae bacterium]|nr:XRE family transcriptional regulator [Acidobacteriaceae bacterium]
MAKTLKTHPQVDTVDEATVETSIETKKIGEKIRRLRLRRSMGLVELGQQVGLSASFLSQLETGRVIPTLRNLARIALVFKKDFSYFLGHETETVFRVSRAKDRIRLPIGETADPFLLSESMSVLIPDRNIVPCIAEFLPAVDGGAFRPPLSPGLELVYVIRGPLVLSAENRTEVLYAEDSAWIDRNSKRLYRCQEDKPARALIVTFDFQS